MIRAPHVALCLLLVLTQSLVPWVHAHTGIEGGGFFHLPGLERLSRPPSDGAASAAQPDRSGHLITVQTGWYEAFGRLDPDSKPISLLPSGPAAPARGRPVARAAPHHGAAPPLPASLHRHDAPPRAPPA